MIPSLSILVPAYNHVPTALVEEVVRQAVGVKGLTYEVIVADDGSPDKALMAPALGRLEKLAGVRIIRMEHNVGRSAIRNVLARAARYDWLLYLDCDVALPADGAFVKRYIGAAAHGGAAVVYGGVTLPPPDRALLRSLRYRYERAALHRFTPERRTAARRQTLRSSNYLIRRETMLGHPYDEGIKGYGYEDVLLSKSLADAGIAILHIDNPIVIVDFGPNAAFVGKTETALKTLYELRREMEGYNGLIALSQRLRRLDRMGIIGCTLRVLLPLLRRWLTGVRRPPLAVYQLYRIGYYHLLTLQEGD